MEHLPEALFSLKSYNQFIVYKIIQGKGKKIKQPADFRTGIVHDAHDPSIWVNADTAVNAAVNLGDGYGVGFVLTDNDPFFLLDIDACLIDGRWSQLAEQLCADFRGAAVEVSLSRTGLHIIAKTEPLKHTCKNKDLHIELYTTHRFIALTGINILGNAGEDCTEILKKTIDKYFKPKEDEAEKPAQTVTAINDDDELLKKALASNSNRSRFNLKSNFSDLFNANVEKLAIHYPADSNSNDPYDASSADAALASHLAFWTGKDENRILSFMWKSKLARDKWNREDYLPRTIKNACNNCANAYQAPAENSTPTAQNQDISTYINPAQQQDLFAGDVYVLEDDLIFCKSNGELLNKSRYDSWKGGHKYVLDASNSKTTPSAWEAFTKSSVNTWPKVTGSVFMPNLPSGEILTINGLEYVNTYYPLTIARKKGDAGLFTRHIEKLWPDAEDQQIALSYLAAMCQFQGNKFQWCIVVQGTQGNGKSFLGDCIEQAVGEKYTQKPNAGQLTSNFNDWLTYAIVAIVEDFHLSSKNRNEAIEIMKPLVTEARQAVEGKGKKKIMRNISTNFLFTTNNANALQKHKDDRRFCMLFTAQQSVEDLARDGMDDRYFNTLQNWARKKGGYAIITDYLMSYDIPDKYNPLICTRAPHTSTTELAIQSSLGTVECAILEVIEEYRIGFRGGWVNSIALRDTLDAKRLHCPDNKMKSLMESIGYIAHPGLVKGRLGFALEGTQSRPRLYILKDHQHAKLEAGKEIGDAYINAQK